MLAYAVPTLGEFSTFAYISSRFDAADVHM